MLRLAKANSLKDISIKEADNLRLGKLIYNKKKEKEQGQDRMFNLLGLE